MKCVYKYDGKTYTYDKLVDELILNKKLDDSDILYSINITRLQRLVEGFSDFIARNKAKKLNGINPALDYSFGGDPTGSENSSSKHCLNFLDDPMFEKAAGKLYIPRMSELDFIDNKIIILKQDNPDLTNEEALNIAKDELKSYKYQRFDGFILHYLLRNSLDDPSIEGIRKKLEELKQEFKDNDDMISRIDLISNSDSLLNNILKALRQFIIGPINQKTGSKVFRNIPISKTIHTDRGNVEIFDQIDALVITESGDIQIYKFKITEEDTSNWGNRKRVLTAKTEKYRFELAFIQAMLEDLGIITKLDRDKISLNLITLQTKYDHNNTQDLPIANISDHTNIVEMSMANNLPQLGKHLQIARNIIQPSLKIFNCSTAVNKANDHLARIWIGQNIKVDAVQDSVQSWILKNKNKNIRKVYPANNKDSNDYYYEIIWEGETYEIKDKTDIEHNKEIEEKVEEILKKSSELSVTATSRLYSAISQAFTNEDGGYLNLDTLGRTFSAATLESIRVILNPYFSYHNDKDGNKIFDWEFLKNTEIGDYNILLFQHRNTKQLDIVTLTDLDLNSKIKLAKGSNLAGSYQSDMNAKLLPSTWGNILAIRTLVFFNYILPNMSGDYKLGSLKVFSTFGRGSSKTFSIQNLIGKYYNPLMSVVQLNTPQDPKFEYNYKDATYIDHYEVLLKYFNELIQGNSNIVKRITSFESRVEALENAKLLNDGAKIEKLIDLANDILERYQSNGYGKTAKEMMESIPDNFDFKILNMIQTTLSLLREQDIDTPVKIPKPTKTFLKTGSIPSNNFKVFKEFWNRASQRINDKAQEIGNDITQLVIQYYKDCGYSSFLNKTWGNLRALFKPLFEDGDQMRFLNPYDMNNGLKDYERKFLKLALFIFAKYRYGNNGQEFKFTDPNSEEYKKFVEENKFWYFNCPLKKSRGKSLDRLSYTMDSAKRNIEKIISDPKLWAKEFLTDELLALYVEDNKMVNDVTKLSVRNYFMPGEVSLNGESFYEGGRDEVLNAHENKDYFEHNVEDLLRDFTFESIRALEMNRMMVSSKLFLMQMYLSGKQNNNTDDFKDEFDTIDSFLRLNVFDLSTMDDTERKIAKITLPITRFIKYNLVAGKISSAVRDSIEGFGQIMARAIVKNETEFSSGDVLRAYNIVVKLTLQDTLHGWETANIVSQLCVKYRMSNIDVANVAEGLKTGGHGINNLIDSMYWTLRKPDFLNRMVLFVSKCIHDGTWDAFSLDDKGNLVYDWKKDKRFNLYATNDQSNLEEYNKQKSLFLSSIKIWNEDHPSKAVENFDTLPMPYTEADIRECKHISDSIWGAYDKSEKALGEFALLGQTFTLFITWMNGQIENYFRPFQTAVDQFEWVLQRDLDGNPLFLDHDGQVTTEDTGVRCMIQMPLQVQGIFQTLKEALAIITGLQEGSLKENIANNKVNLNNMKKLGTDMLMTLILWLIIKQVVDALREKQKEVTDPHDVITNGICEVLSKGMYNAWDGFQGPLNLVFFLGEQTNPPMYTEGLAMIKDFIKVLSGDYTLLSFGSRHFGPLASFKETIKADTTGKQPKTYHKKP